MRQYEEHGRSWTCECGWSFVAVLRGAAWLGRGSHDKALLDVRLGARPLSTHRESSSCR